MSDALVSPPVFVAAGAASVALIAAAVHRLTRGPGASNAERSRSERLVPLMGVMGAFVFAAQMINFSIPGTGSSGHLVGGILLAAILGPWAAFLTLSSVLVLQCLLFADGGFMALGCNILNMAALSTLVAYPLVFRPLQGSTLRGGRTLAASLTASVVALQLGALAVVAETEASGITALPFGRFLLFMLPIHFFIGIGEGLATAAVLGVVGKFRPELLHAHPGAPRPRKLRGALAGIALAALLLAGSFSWIASSDPDGLEWSIGRLTGGEELETATEEPLHRKAAALQEATAMLPGYDASLAGIVGSGFILIAALGASYALRAREKQP